MKAFILPPGNRVQIGDTIYNTNNNQIEQSRAGRPGLAEESLNFVDVPCKSLEYAIIAVTLASRKNNKHGEDNVPRSYPRKIGQRADSYVQ